MADRVTLAAITGAHGIRGEVVCRLFTEGHEALGRYQQVFVGDRRLTLSGVRPHKAGAVVRFREISDRTAAEGLRGKGLEVERSALEAPADGEVYHIDLIGLPVVDAAGQAIGAVVAVQNFGAGDLLDVELTGGRRVYLPFRDGVVDVGSSGVRLLEPAYLE